MNQHHQHNIPPIHQGIPCCGNSLILSAWHAESVELHVWEMDYHLLKFYQTKEGHSYKINMSWNMYQNAEIEASNDDSYPETRGNKSYIGYLKSFKELKLHVTKYPQFTTLLYSHRKPERCIAISCNGHWITLSIKALIFGGCKATYRPIVSPKKKTKDNRLDRKESEEFLFWWETKLSWRENERTQRP